MSAYGESVLKNYNGGSVELADCSIDGTLATYSIINGNKYNDNSKITMSGTFEGYIRNGPTIMGCLINYAKVTMQGGVVRESRADSIRNSVTTFINQGGDADLQGGEIINSTATSTSQESAFYNSTGGNVWHKPGHTIKNTAGGYAVRNEGAWDQQGGTVSGLKSGI